LTGGTGTSVSLGGLSSSTFYNITVTVYSSTGNSASASVGFNTLTAFVTPSISRTTDPPAFYRAGTTFAWGWNNATYSGSTSGNPFYPWRIRSGSSSGTIIASGTRTYTVTTVALGTGQPRYNYRIGTQDGDTPTTALARWGSYSADILGTNGQTYSSGYSASV
jgi:hypothetical protein